MDTNSNDHTVTTVMVTIVHPKEEPSAEVAAAVGGWIASRAPSTWGLGETVKSSSVGTSAVGEDEIDWRA